MFIELAKVSDIEDIGGFISKLNKERTSHSGYVGFNVNEIINDINENFIVADDHLSFVIMRNEQNEMIAAIGLDIDEHSAEVWGPYSATINVTELKKLWDVLVQTFFNINTFYFFINKLNLIQQKFLESLGAKNTGEHLILKISKSDLPIFHDKFLVPFTLNDREQFAQLHNEAFPNTYYDAQTIVSRRSKHNQLLVLKNENSEIQGYAYFEIDTVFEEASLEYIAISPKFQNQGLGTKLLKEVLQEIFNYENINEIRLCVINNNYRANHVYFKAGFNKENILISYTLKH